MINRTLGKKPRRATLEPQNGNSDSVMGFYREFIKGAVALLVCRYDDFMLSRKQAFASEIMAIKK